MKNRITKDQAIKELSSKTHLNMLQINKIIGTGEDVDSSLVATIIKISDQTEQQIRANQKSRAKPLATSKRINTKVSRSRLSFDLAKSVIEHFAESEAL